MHNFGILEMVSKLMKVPEPLQADWSNVYLLCMEESAKYKITNNGASLKPLAEVQYIQLKQFLRNRRFG